MVPDAVVHHGFGASAQRRADRVPLSLTDIGASSAYFLRRHAPNADLSLQHGLHQQTQRARLLGHMMNGGLEPRDIGLLLKSFEKGWEAGLPQEFVKLSLGPISKPVFLRLPTVQRQGLLISGRIWQRRELLRRAGVQTAMGKIVTVICLSPTTWYHRHKFESGGFWMQQGGVYGRSVREQPFLQIKHFATRLREEATRVSMTRPVV